MFPSSGKMMGVPSLLGPLERASLNHWTTEVKRGKAVPLHAMEALGGRGGIAPTHSRPRH
jgi:hypothetical protein